MPVIYEGRCSACDAVTRRTSDGYQAVYVDEPVAAYAHPDDPRLAILAHPCETLILNEIGYTHEAAAWSGRLVVVRQVFCKACGRPFEIRRVTAPLTALGCSGRLGVVASAAAASMGIGLLLGGGWVGCIVGWATFAVLVGVVESLLERFVRRRHAELASRLDMPALCPSCGSLRFTSPGWLRGPIPCTTCGQRAVRFRSVGRS